MRVRLPAFLGLLAGVQVVGGLVAWLQHPPPEADYWLPLETLVFALVGSALLLGANEARAQRFGIALVVVASSFAYVPVRSHEALRPLASFRADAFLGWIYWTFAVRFPRVEARGLATRLGPGLAFVAGLGLWATEFLAVDDSWARAFSRSVETSHYWTVSYGLVLLGSWFMAARVPTATPEERARVSRLLRALLIVAIPLSVAILLESLVPGVRTFLQETIPGRLVRRTLQALILLLPPLAAYAVVTDAALSLRDGVKGPARYQIARGVLETTLALPWLWLVIQLLELRALSLDAMAAGGQWLLLVVPISLGLLGLRLREAARQRLRRAFLIDSGAKYPGALKALGEQLISTRSPAEACATISRFASETLHARRCTVYLAEPRRDRLSATGRGFSALSLEGAVADTLRQSPGAVDVAEITSVREAELSLEERQWLSDGEYSLLAPIRGNEGGLLGCLAVAHRRSDLPFDRDERTLLEGVTAAAALALELSALRSDAVGSATPSSERAWVCASCDRVGSEDEACACGVGRHALKLPLVLLGKFRFEARLGGGGMGVVYRARDLTLDRPVAIKTLPRRSPEEAAFLRSEARLMARVEHPNVARILGAETWHGTPLLVVELLERGTLADHLAASGPLDDETTLQLARDVLGGLEHLHRRGVLHYDVKPTNIGRGSDGTWKLLDFGVAELHSADEARSPHLRGTPLYMSPEAAAAGSRGPSVDLWSAALTLVEARLGHYPRSGEGLVPLALVGAAVAAAQLDAVGCAPTLRATLLSSLGLDPNGRPPSAAALLAALESGKGRGPHASRPYVPS